MATLLTRAISFSVKTVSASQWQAVDGRTLGTTVMIRGTIRGEMYVPIVAYEYHLKQRTYESTRIAFGQINFATRERAAEYADSLVSDGSRVRVYVNPDNLSEAVLINRMHRGIVEDYLGACLGLVVFGIGFYGVRRFSRPSGIST